MNITTKISTARQSKVHKYWKNGIGILELAAITALPIMPKFIQRPNYSHIDCVKAIHGIPKVD